MVFYDILRHGQDAALNIQPTQISQYYRSTQTLDTDNQCARFIARMVTTFSMESRAKPAGNQPEQFRPPLAREVL